MATWFTSYVANGDLPAAFSQHSSALLFSYGGLFFDLLIVPALLWKKTRLAAYIIAVCFHLANAFIFNIGVFPWFMIAATTLFFSGDWCKKLLKTIRSKPKKKKKTFPINKAVVLFAAAYCLLQILIPLRHFVIPGNVHWTEEGHRFSWHMKLRDKSAMSIFFIEKTEGKKDRVPVLNYLTNKQALEMATQPDMMHQFGQYMREIYIAEGVSNPKITVASFCSLNGRPKQQFVDPNFNLAKNSSYDLPADWILPIQANKEGD